MKEERLTLKDVVLLVYLRGDATIAPNACTQPDPHWPHIVAIEDKNVVICPGRSGKGLYIFTGQYTPTFEWVIVDRDSKRYNKEKWWHNDSRWEAVTYPKLEVTRITKEGTRRDCKDHISHLPHVLSTYSTVRNGVLDVYCPGRSGPRYGIYELYWKGDAQVADRSSFFIVKYDDDE